MDEISLKPTRICFTSLGNAGILVRTASLVLAVDPYFPDGTGEKDVSTQILHETPVDGFLISHEHWDHFDPVAVSRIALSHGSWIAGPGPVISMLKDTVPDNRLILMEPPWNGIDGAVSTQERSFTGGLSVTALRTPHGRVHVSYLVKLPEGRLYFDCDNHDTRILPLHLISPLDALFLYPWERSGAGEFVRACKPGVWFLVHLSEAEMKEHRNGQCAKRLAYSVRVEPVVLEPGEIWCKN